MIPDCVLHRSESPAHKCFKSEEIPDCVLHTEKTVTCKQRFR